MFEVTPNDDLAVLVGRLVIDKVMAGRLSAVLERQQGEMDALRTALEEATQTADVQPNRRGDRK